MPTYTYHCGPCDHITDVFFSLSEVRPEDVLCESCQGTATYQLAAPMVLKHSYLDGQRSKKFRDLKEASKLNVAAARTDDLDQKKELKKEISKIGYTFEKD